MRQNPIRDKAILGDSENGMSVRALAVKYGLSPTRTHSILVALRGQPVRTPTMAGDLRRIEKRLELAIDTCRSGLGMVRSLLGEA